MTNNTRSSGVLMHISTLPGTPSVGGFGEEAKRFIDLIADAGFTWWQVLPFCVTDECNSPYKSFGAFSGNPYFVDIRRLRDEGLLTDAEVDAAREQTPYACEFEVLNDTRMPLLRLAASRCGAQDRQAVHAFLDSNPYVHKFCTFMALRQANGNMPWYEWQTNEADPAEYFAWGFIQHRFHTQWQDIHDYAARKGVKLMGDMPIYVAYDSCDVWSCRNLYQLDEDGRPTAVAGCPPDYFSADGQLWGNPLYDWDRMKQDRYAWWYDRMRFALSMFDGVRIDHFRGFESYWSIPAEAETARAGHWEPGPGLPLVDTLKRAAADTEAETGRSVMIVAEDLGDSTPALAKFVQDSGFPGMRVLQFAFDGDMSDPDNIHLPYNHPHNCVAYTGTHDNNTLLGFVFEADADTRRHVLAYCGFDESEWNCPAAYRAVERTLFASPADLCILPVQDLLCYGADTRMNIPGKPEGNWRYRVTASQLDSIDVAWFRRMNRLYGRSKP